MISRSTSGALNVNNGVVTAAIECKFLIHFQSMSCWALLSSQQKATPGEQRELSSPCFHQHCNFELSNGWQMKKIARRIHWSNTICSTTICRCWKWWRNTNSTLGQCSATSVNWQPTKMNICHSNETRDFVNEHVQGSKPIAKGQRMILKGYIKGMIRNGEYTLVNVHVQERCFKHKAGKKFRVTANQYKLFELPYCWTSYAMQGLTHDGAMTIFLFFTMMV